MLPITNKLLTIVKRNATLNNSTKYNRTESLCIGESMSTATRPMDVMRESADWMTPSDDRILELIREHGNLTPIAIEAKGGPVRQYASTRCKQLSKYGLLNQVHRGLYGITDDGRAYLDEELDAAELEPVE